MDGVSLRRKFSSEYLQRDDSIIRLPSLEANYLISSSEIHFFTPKRYSKRWLYYAYRGDALTITKKKEIVLFNNGLVKIMRCRLASRK